MAENEFGNPDSVFWVFRDVDTVSVVCKGNHAVFFTDGDFDMRHEFRVGAFGAICGL